MIRGLTVTISEAESNPAIKIVVLEGILDTINLKILNEKILQLIKADKTTLIADCRELTYMNSTGLGGLIDYCRMCQERKGDLKLAGVDEKVCEIISIVGADRFFNMYDTVEEAITAFEN